MLAARLARALPRPAPLPLLRRSSAAAKKKPGTGADKAEKQPSAPAAAAPPPAAATPAAASDAKAASAASASSASASSASASAAAAAAAAAKAQSAAAAAASTASAAAQSLAAETRETLKRVSSVLQDAAQSGGVRAAFSGSAGAATSAAEWARGAARGVAAVLEDPRRRRYALYGGGALALYLLDRRQRNKRAARRAAEAEKKAAASAAETRAALAAASVGPGSDKYDVVVDCDDIRHLATNGWLVEVGRDLGDRTGIVVGVLGIYNRGKTFVLNKISHGSLPENQRIRTRGLSFKAPSSSASQGLVLLDTAGLEAPVQVTDLDAMKSRHATDLLNSEIAYEMSDVVVVVVSDITLQDQTFLKAVYDQVKTDRKRFTDVVVVHNFKDVEGVELAQALWKTQVVDAYPGASVEEPLNFSVHSDAKADMGAWWRHVESPGDTVCMRHVMLAREGSPAGNAINDATFRLLHKWVSTVSPGEKRPVLERYVATANGVLAENGVALALKDEPADSAAPGVVHMRLVAHSVEPKRSTTAPRLRDRLDAAASAQPIALQ